MSATDFRLHDGPAQVTPAVFVGHGTTTDDSTRIYLHANNAELTPSSAIDVAIALLTQAREAMES